MRNLFEAFVRERRYGKGVSERTEEWYWQSWKIFAAALEPANTETLSKEAFVRVIEPMYKRGVSATINTYARAINAFLRWLHTLA